MVHERESVALSTPVHPEMISKCLDPCSTGQDRCTKESIIYFILSSIEK